MVKDNSIKAFFDLVRAGLWEKGTNLSNYGEIDYEKLYSLAEEQAVFGLVAAGMERIVGRTIPKEIALQFVGQTLKLEQQNAGMNQFLGGLVERMRSYGIYTLLVKGQGIAQCYERPLWRSCGDIDFYLSEENFQKAKSFFRPLVESFDPDNEYTKHINMHCDTWAVEIHENQHTKLSKRVDRVLDDIHYDLFNNGNIRSCLIGKMQVFLPSIDNDVLIVFTHFIKHFYKGGLGIRQICDWCRLLWKFRDRVNIETLEKRLHKMGLMGEWKAFGAFAVDFLGMPEVAMPFYEEKSRWHSKAKRIKDFILETGNFGHNRDVSYYGKYPRLVSKIISYSMRIGDAIHHASIFPYDSMRFMVGITVNGLRSVAHED